MREPLVLVVNGEERRLTVDPKRTLLEVLHDDLDLTGCKYGCGEGQCGACTVLLDGRAVRSCRVPVGAAGGLAVRTIEGLADGERLHPVQQAFLDATALQCGYCTPGMILTALELLERGERPSERDVVAHMNGNVCRCGTYPRIVRAVLDAAESMQEGGR